MMVDVSLATTRRSSAVVAFGPRIALTAIVVTGVLVRFGLAMGREVQRYLPDEYLYGQLARSVAEGHGFRILGMPNAMPALLQPLITAPAWLTGDPELAFRITQAINAVAMGLGAIVVFAIARTVGIRPWHAVAAAAVAMASPDLVYAGYVTADSIGYLLALTAVLAAVRALERPSLRAQSLFLAAAALATFARMQYAALVIAVAVAAAIVERGRPGALIRRHALLVGAPLAGAAAIMGRGGVGPYYESVLSFRISVDTVGWFPVSAVLLAVAAGIIIVPGAVVWTVSQIARPTSRARLAFAAVGALSLTLLLVASALFASETASNRFYERYLMIGIPLAAVAFCCWIAEARPLRGISVAMAAFLVVAAARVPISEYAVGQGMADSPLLSAVNRLEGAIEVGNASLFVAVAATACAVIAVATALGKVGSGGALAATAVVLTVVSVGAHAADRQHSAYIVSDVLHAAPDWVDVAGGKNVLLLEPSGNSPEAAMLLALRNSSIGGIALLGSHAQQFAGATRRLTVDDQGALRLGSDPMHHQLLLDGTSTRIIVAGGRTIRQRGGFTLIARRDQARLGVTVEGLYADGWLAGSGSMTIYATGRPGLCRDATLHLTLPRRHSPVRITIAEAGGRRSIVVNPGSTSVVSISGSSIYRRTLVLRAATWTIVGTPRLRTISVKALLSTRVASCTGYRE